MTKKNTAKETEKTTAGESIAEVVDQIFSEEIESGKFFEKSFEDHVQRLSPDMIMKLMDKIDSYSLITLFDDYKLNKKILHDWFDDYKKFRIKLKFTNKQLTIHSTTPEQIILYYYLVKIGVINEDVLDSVVKTSKHKATLLAFLFSKSEDNVRLGLREANIKGKDGNYYKKATLDRLLELAEETKFDVLKQLVENDIKKRTK